MGPVLRSRGSPLRTSLPISSEAPTRLFEIRSLETMLPPLLPSLQLEAAVERSCPARYKYLFLPLLGSLLSFLLIISVSFDPAFPLLTARSTLFRGAKNQIF